MTNYKQHVKIFSIFLIFLSLTFMNSCVYKVEITQGDNRLLENYKKLQVGWNEKDVINLLGEPQARSLFDNRGWNYVYQVRPAGFFNDTKILSIELVFNKTRQLEKINVLINDFEENSSE